MKSKSVIIIAEAGVNHNGSMNYAKKLVDIGFNLGPCLNSSSRLGYPDLTIKLLIEKK